MHSFHRACAFPALQQSPDLETAIKGEVLGEKKMHRVQQGKEIQIPSSAWQGPQNNVLGYCVPDGAVTYHLSK